MTEKTKNTKSAEDSASSGDEGERGSGPASVQQLVDMGSSTVKNARGTIHCLTIVGQVEGHMLAGQGTKTTKYEHVMPLLAALEGSEDVDGLLLLLNTVGGDIEAGLGIAELVAGMSKPTVSLVLGGSHSIGVPLAVSAKTSFAVPSAAMTGGSVNRSAGVLSRAAELRTLSGKADALHAQLSAAAKEEEELKRELSAAQYEMETAEGQRRQAEDEVLRLEGRKNHFDILIQGLREKLENLSGELEALNGRLADNRERAAAAQAEAAEKDAQAAQFRAQAEAAQSGQTELLAQSGRLSEEISAKKSGIAALGAEKETTGRNLEDLRRLCEQMTGDRAEKERQTEEYRRNIETAERESEERRAVIAQMQTQRGALQERLNALSQEKIALEAERTAKNRAGQEMNEELLKLERAASGLEQKIAAGAMRGMPTRAAHFSCAVACAFPSGDTLTAEGRCDGTIAYAPMGTDGFGYDPVFLVPEKARTFAQLTGEEKSAISHRGRALAAFAEKLETYLKS